MRTKLPLALLILCFAVGAVNAQVTTPYSVANPDSALQTILANLAGSPLLLRDAVKLGLANATSVRAAEASYMAAKGAARREAGYFDPEIFFSFNHINQDQPTASFFSGASVLSTTESNARGGVRINLPIGTSIEASLNTVKLETNSAFAFLNPQYNAFGTLSLRQPLLRGFFISGNKNAARADRELEAAKARYDQESLATSSQVEGAYWDLYAAERDYAVQRLTRDRADAFLKETETRARTGLIGPNQVANARTFLAEQEILLLDREEALDGVSDALSSLIGQRPDASAPRYLTADTPPDDFPLEDVELLVQRALRDNLTIQAARADVEAVRTLSRAASWEALPQVDFIGSLGGNGLAGTAQSVIFGNDTLTTTRGGTYGDAVSDAVKRNFPTWSVGVEVSIPIGLRSGFGEQERLEAELTRAQQREIQLSRALEEQVRASYRDVSNVKRRLKAAKEGVEAAQEQVRIGLVEFQNGRSTAFELVRLGTDFAVAQQRYSQALVRGAKAAAELTQLTSGAYGATP